MGEELTEEERGAEGGSRGYRVTKEAATPLAEGGGTAARGRGGENAHDTRDNKIPRRL